MRKMANVLCLQHCCHRTDVLPDRRTQEQNFNRVFHMTVISHNCAFIDYKQSAILLPLIPADHSKT